MKKLLIMIPVWKRPEILKLFISRLNFPNYMNVRALFLISPEDPFYKANLKLINGFDRFICENEPLGKKKNAGLNYALQWDWDYYMDLGSDDIINPELWEFYKPYFQKEKYFGLNGVYVLDLKTDKTIYLDSKDYCEGNAVGPGRVIHRSIIDSIGQLWRNDHHVGMDMGSNFYISRMGFFNNVIDVKEYPYILDIKTGTNLSPFMEVEDIGKEVDAEMIKIIFRIENSKVDPVYFTTIEINDFHKRVENNTQLFGNKQDAFNAVNNEYCEAFGCPRFKSYESYRTTISKHFKRS